MRLENISQSRKTVWRGSLLIVKEDFLKAGLRRVYQPERYFLAGTCYDR
jgi:hypothetical protein